MSTFFIASLKWTKRRDGLITLWGPKNSDYVFRLECAGRYTDEQIRDRADYYNDGKVTLAVICARIEALSTRVGDSTSRSLDIDRDVEQRVVEYRHLRALKREFGCNRGDASPLDLVKAAAAREGRALSGAEGFAELLGVELTPAERAQLRRRP